MSQASTPSEPFPRSSDLPNQSPKYWAMEKDRYLRQLLIKDIQNLTGRSLIVYFAQLDQEINHTDPDDISEILQGISSKSADIIIQTPGGNVDATEKVISVLQHFLDDYRVIVPSWAKSAGTVISLSSSKIILGLNSELGPIDPQWKINGNNVPCELLAKDPALPQHMRDMAKLNADRMRIMAKELLSRGMLKGKPDSEIDSVVARICSSDSYMSHGAVIDFDEAKHLTLSVEYLPPDSPIWQRIWLLYCMYDYDTKAKNVGRIIEGTRFSISRPK